MIVDLERSSKRRITNTSDSVTESNGTYLALQGVMNKSLTETAYMKLLDLETAKVNADLEKERIQAGLERLRIKAKMPSKSEKCSA